MTAARAIPSQHANRRLHASHEATSNSAFIQSWLEKLRLSRNAFWNRQQLLDELFSELITEMLRQRKIIVVMPAYNAAKTLVRTHTEVSALGIVDQVIVVDDASHDETLEIAGTLENTLLYLHPKNLGYGANQKSCYRLALEHGADIAIMVHPDYQYTPRLIPAMAELIASGLYDAVLASRILGGGALRGGMPMWRYVSNRLLTFIENLLTGAKLSEYHTGYRAFSREVLETLTLDSNSNDFVFDNQVIAQMLWSDFRIAEVTCPTRYFKEASSISLARCIRYGLGCIGVGLAYRLAKIGVPVCGKLFPAKTASSERSTPLESGPLD